MFVTLAKHQQTLRILAGESKRRQEAEQRLIEKDAKIARLEARIAHDLDEHPDVPVPVKPAAGDARLVQLLALSERARRDLDQQCLGLHRANMLQEHELCYLREQIADLQAALKVQEVAS